MRGPRPRFASPTPRPLSCLPAAGLSWDFFFPGSRSCRPLTCSSWGFSEELLSALIPNGFTEQIANSAFLLSSRRKRERHAHHVIFLYNPRNIVPSRAGSVPSLDIHEGTLTLRGTRSPSSFLLLIQEDLFGYCFLHTSRGDVNTLDRVKPVRSPMAPVHSEPLREACLPLRESKASLDDANKATCQLDWNIWTSKLKLGL